MIHLLDVNVLVALFDPGHIHHDAAHAWFAEARTSGWATCPPTENGFVRVVANPAYPGRRTRVAGAIDHLRRFAAGETHVFWAAGVSVLDRDAVDAEHLSGHREVTDTYLLALAVQHGGALATFDRSIRTEAVPGARPEHRTVLRTGAA